MQQAYKMVGERKKYQGFNAGLKTEEESSDDKELGKHVDPSQQQVTAF